MLVLITIIIFYIRRDFHELRENFCNMKVCRNVRWNKWESLLCGKTIFVFLLQISDPVFFSNCSILIKDVPCKLQYLDLSMAIISEEGIKKLRQFWSYWPFFCNYMVFRVWQMFGSVHQPDHDYICQENLHLSICTVAISLHKLV